MQAPGVPPSLPSSLTHSLTLSSPLPFPSFSFSLSLSPRQENDRRQRYFAGTRQAKLRLNHKRRPLHTLGTT